MFLGLVLELLVWIIQSPKVILRILTGRARTSDWGIFGWVNGSHALSAKELADIEARESQKAAQSRIDDILYAKSRPLRGAKEKPWGKKR